MNTALMKQQAAEVALFADALEERERKLAAAIEDLSQDSAVQAAWHQGGQYQLDRVVALIDLQLAQLSYAGTNAVVLRALRRQPLEVEA